MLPELAHSGVIWAAGVLLAVQLVAVAWIDACTMRIPDGLNAALLGTALAFAAWAGLPVLRHAAISAVVCFLIMAGAAWVYEVLRGRVGLGGGDIKLAAAGGAWIGLENAQVAMLIASCTALTWVLALSWRGVGLSLSTRLAFGPFLSLGIGFAWLLQT